ncbi:hypothetical protein [Cumulibacter soli]|nr:hypothetical protein [Cumulibacter soli]
MNATTTVGSAAAQPLPARPSAANVRCRLAVTAQQVPGGDGRG